MATSGNKQSATRRRCEEQLARLEELPADAAVTALRPVGEDDPRVVVRVGKWRFGPLHAADRDTLGLTVGDRLDAPARARLGAALSREAARTDALALLRTRSRSRRDLLHRLALKGHPLDDATAALDRLARVGLLDDGSLARDRAGVMADSGRTGPRAAEVKLRSLGIAGPVAAEAVRDAYAGADLLEQATELAHKRARSFGASLDREARQRRLYGYLARRGYDHDICRRATEAALGRPNDD
ncbi:MAG: RecX family transcriptional regulator [Phycisphaerales bacterium]|nr:RecX family transcriptional regulator [Phycisphaerales bacterium]